MKAPVDNQTKRVSMNLTPMIDVVFLLIIFFVVSNTMMQNDVSHPVELPAAESGRETGNKETGKIILNIDADGSLFFGARGVTRDEFKTALLNEKSRSQKPLEIRIRLDRSVRWRIVEPILILCAETGIGSVSFSVIPK